MDLQLKEGGFRTGTLVEWFGAGEGAATTTLAMIAARSACGQRGTLVVMDHRGEFYPPAAFRWGWRPEQLLLVRPQGQAELVWAMDQVLRCGGVAAMLAWPRVLAGRDFRRLQLAVSAGGGLGLLVRPRRARCDPSWAEVRLDVEALGSTGLAQRRRVRMVLLRSYGGARGIDVDVEIDEETCTVYPVAGPADPAATDHAAGA